MFEWLFWLSAVMICFLKANGFQPTYLLGGFLGGLVKSIVSKTGSKWEKLLSGFTGAILATYFGPLICLLLGIPDLQNAVAFVCGLLGMHVTEAFVNLAKMYSRHPGKLKEDLREIILRLIDKR